MAENGASLAVVAFPGLSPADHGWVDSLRSRHLSDFENGIGPHLTLVFPFPARTAGEEASALTHVRAVASAAPRFAAVFRAALALPDVTTGEFIVALVPDEGMSHAIRLHDRLYTGPFAEHLRLDIPFVPHVTVARMANPASAKALADDLNGGDPAIVAQVDAFALLRIRRPKVETMATVRLGG